MGLDCRWGFAVVHRPMHIVCFVLNVLLPGTGSMVSACCDVKGFNSLALIFGLLQFFFCWTIVAWFWSAFHGYIIYKSEPGSNRFQPVPSEDAKL